MKQNAFRDQNAHISRNCKVFAQPIFVSFFCANMTPIFDMRPCRIAGSPTREKFFLAHICPNNPHTISECAYNFQHFTEAPFLVNVQYELNIFLVQALHSFWDGIFPPTMNAPSPNSKKNSTTYYLKRKYLNLEIPSKCIRVIAPHCFPTQNSGCYFFFKWTYCVQDHLPHIVAPLRFLSPLRVSLFSAAIMSSFGVHRCHSLPPRRCTCGGWCWTSTTCLSRSTPPCSGRGS